MNAEKEKLLNEIIEWTEQYWKVAMKGETVSKTQQILLTRWLSASGR